MYGGSTSNPGKKSVAKKVPKKKPMARKKTVTKNPAKVAAGGKATPRRKKSTRKAYT